jgi:AcrR family transcriptional regulator
MAGKRELIIETAERLFYTEGFHATGIDRVTAEAGVARMTLYNHFPSKYALVAEVLRTRHDRFLASLDAAVADAAPGVATRALVEAHCAWVAGDGRHGCIMVKAMGEFAAHSDEVHGLAAAAKDDLRVRIADALVRDGFAEAAALERRIFVILEGCNAAVPMLGAETALADTRAAINDLLVLTEGRKETA